MYCTKWAAANNCFHDWFIWDLINYVRYKTLKYSENIWSCACYNFPPSFPSNKSKNVGFIATRKDETFFYFQEQAGRFNAAYTFGCTLTSRTESNSAFTLSVLENSLSIQVGK